MSSSIRSRIYHVLDVVLRVPPIFIMDSIFVNNMKIPQFYDSFTNTMFRNNNYVPLEGDRMNVSVLPPSLNKSSQSNFEGDDFYIIISNTSSIFLVIAYAIVFSISLCLFLLTTKHLIQVYKWFTSVAIVIWSYFLNDNFVRYIESKKEEPRFQEFSYTDGICFVAIYTLQVSLALAFIYASGHHKNFVAGGVAAFFFILPCLSTLSLLFTSKLLTFLPVTMLVISLIYIVVSLILNVKEIWSALCHQFIWIKTFVRNYGLYILLESQWTRLHVPQVLRVFWLTRLTEQALFIMLSDSDARGFVFTSFPSVSLDSQAILVNIKYLLVRGCETVIAVLGMTSVLSGLSHQIGAAMQVFLVVEDPEDRSIGAVSAILFFILALQNGLIAMEPEKRFLRLYRNFCLLFTAILHFIHNMVSPLLFSLSASRNMSINRHCRALIVCIFLFISPIVFLYYLWAHHSLSTWLLAVTAFSIEVIIKVVISLLIYTLFMVDAFRSSMWEQLDDYVYYIRAIGNSIEFLFGIFLFCNGAWILLLESGGTIRALMLIIHAYVNIYNQALAGWKTFIKRRHAVHKINSLPEATAEQLLAFDDVCAICYQELTTARITRCNHYFHSVCLRKWLYLQDICPLCHKTLYNVKETNAESISLLNNEHEHND